MNGTENKPKATQIQILITIAAFVVVIAGMRAAKAIIVPFLLASFIAIISAPPLFWLKKRKLPTWLSLLIVMLGILSFGLIIAGLVGSSVKDFLSKLPFYEVRLRAQTANLLGWLNRLGVDVSSIDLTEIFDPGAAMKLVASVLNELGGVFTNGFLILLTVIFMLLEASSFPAKFRAIFLDPEASLVRFKNFTSNVNRYMAIKTGISFVTGALVAIFLTIIGVHYPLLWGLLAFVLNYIPNIGSIIAAVPAVLLAVIQLGIGKAILVAAGYIIINLFMGNVIEPRFMGRGLGLSTLVVFLSLLFWGWVLGPVGMLLSVPLTMTVKIALDSSEDTRWIAILLGSEKAALMKSPVDKAKSSLENEDSNKG